jgi:hypothetical protein
MRFIPIHQLRYNLKFKIKNRSVRIDQRGQVVRNIKVYSDHLFVQILSKILYIGESFLF